NGPAPYWVCAHMDKDGKFVVDVPVVTYKTVTTKIKKDGEEKEAYYYEPDVTVHSKRFESTDVKVSNASGKVIDTKDAQKLLLKRTVVLVSADGRKVDPFYLQIVKESTLVLVVSKPLWDPPVSYQPSYPAPPVEPYKP